jgi:hypothetical protein
MVMWYCIVSPFGEGEGGSHTVASPMDIPLDTTHGNSCPETERGRERERERGREGGGRGEYMLGLIIPIKYHLNSLR